MHYCSQCGHEIPHRGKKCQNCGTQVEYLCALAPLPSEPARRRKVRTAASITKWIVGYVIAVILTFGLSFLYFSSPGILGWTTTKSTEKPDSVAAQPLSATALPVRSESSSALLKNLFNQLSVGVQKTTILLDESRKVNVAGDAKRTAANYRAVQRSCDALLAQLTVPPDALPEFGAVFKTLKESLLLLGKSASTMADYLEGKLSLGPPNPDWVARSQELSAQSQARIKEAQQALANLRKKLE